MSTKNKQQLKQEFLSGSKITQAKLEDLIDSSVNKVDDLSIDANGNVGIGIAPSTGVKLEVDGNTSLNGTLEVTGNTTIEGILNAKGTNSYFNGKVGIGLQPTDYTPNINLAIGDHDTGLNQVGDGVLTILTNGSERLRIDQEGNVGIGTSSPSAGVKLEVNGNTSLGGTLAVTGATTLNSDLTVTGNFTVNGTTTTISSENHVVDDNLMGLGNGTTGVPINDSGIIIERGSSDNVFMGWDESADKFMVGTTTATGASSGDLSITKGILVADIEGNITGEVQTAAQPNITSLGTLTGLNVTGATTLSDTLTVSGTGGHSFAGNVGIGTTVPAVKLEVQGETGNDVKFRVKNKSSDNTFTVYPWGGGTNIYNEKDNSPTYFGRDGGEGDWIFHNGNVGIGTMPSAGVKLEVDGNMKVTYIVQEPWQDLTLENSWVRFRNDHNPPQYFKDSQGIVHLRGLVKSGTGRSIATLPDGYRPSFKQIYVGLTSPNASCRIDITNAGSIVLPGSYDSSWVSLDGITFRTA